MVGENVRTEVSQGYPLLIIEFVITSALNCYNVINYYPDRIQTLLYFLDFKNRGVTIIPSLKTSLE